MKSLKRNKIELLKSCLNINVFSIFLCAIILLSTSNGEKTGDEYLEHFRKFSEDLISRSKETTEATEIKPGVHMYNPFGVGILLAHINEQVWNVPTNGIPEALHVSKKSAVATEYAQLLRQFRRRQFRISNTVYSRFGNLTRPMAFDQFLTHIINLDFTNQTAEFIDSFNSFIDLGTKGHLNNEIVPKMLWRKVFENVTMGSYLNTVYYKGAWDTPWTSIGDQPFNFDSLVPFMESHGTFKIAENENITAIKLDIQGPAKQLILFKAHTFMDTPNLHEEFLKLQANESLWTMQNLTVQIPSVNATNMARHHLGLSFMGVNETFCRNNNVSNPLDFYYSQQPITQGNHFELSPSFVEIASASGTLVNYQNDDFNLTDPEFSEDYYDDDYEVVETDPDSLDDIEEHVNSRQLKKTNRLKRATTTKTLGGCGRTEDLVGGPTSAKNTLRAIVKFGKNGRIISFDTPFSWVLQDQEIGEVFYGHISSLCQFNKATNAIYASPTHAWLHDVFKVAFWKCLSR